VKDLDALPNRTARRVLDALEQLGKDPGSSELDVKPLVGRRPWRRYRVGDFRIVFRLAEQGRVLLVARVVDRKELERALRTLSE
jgi:mRNA-degrading endonuclease RelE of RelBE toxin-antitoxin system